MSLCSDFLVQVLGWDKVELMESKSIYTSSNKPHVCFFNYYLMNWTIVQIPKLQYCESSFEEVNYQYYDFYFISNRDELDASYEISQIKKKVKCRKELECFFK